MKRHKNVPFSIVQADAQHIDEIESLLYPAYFNETLYRCGTYNAEVTKRTIRHWLQCGVGFIIRSEGKTAAFGCVGFGQQFCDETEADIDMFFVLPEFRKTGIARVLADLLDRTAAQAGTKFRFTTCASGLGGSNNSLYANLWKKFGFRSLGTIMVKD